MSALVDIRGVTKDYPLGKTVVQALRGINLTIEQGEFTAIAGPSGSGKTTLLNLIGCVDVPTLGTVSVAGQSVETLDDKARTELRLRNLGFIFQTFNLVQVLNLFQNVEFPLLLQGDLTKTERRKRVEEIIEKVGLTPQMKQRPTNSLAGSANALPSLALW